MAARILVDLLGFTGSRGGTETYARELLPRVAAAMPDVQFAAITGRGGAERVAEFFPGRIHRVSWVGADPASWAAGAVLATNALARRNDADLVWAPANFGPIRHGVPRVVTIHDAIYDEVPGDYLQRAQRKATSWLMTLSARTADLLLTVSRTAAASIHDNLGVPDSRIRVVYNGSEEPRPVARPWSTLAPLGLTPDRPIVLSTGSRMPHKNFRSLLDALSRIGPDNRPLTVISGSRLPDPLAAEVARLELSRDVVLPGWVDADQLEALYQVAALYVCPSLAEGFGLPVVDAMRRGVPVLANDIPVLREVGGAAARYVPVGDAEAFAAAITYCVGARSDVELDAAGRAWAGKFTWERAAEATADALNEVLERASKERA